MIFQRRLARMILDLFMWFLALEIRKAAKPTSLVSERVTFYSRADKILLRGWLYQSSSNRCIILVPGGASKLIAFLIGLRLLSWPETARHLAEKDYSVLLFHLRGHGDSEGNWGSLDIGKEYRDVLGAFDYLTKVRGFAPEHIGIVGFSLGAVAALIAATYEPKIPAVVAESSWAEFDFNSAFIKPNGKRRNWMKCIVPILRWSIENSGVELPNLLNTVPTIQAKILFIHGEKDEVILSKESQKLFTASPGSELWIMEGVSHCGAFGRNLIEYVQRVTTFFKKHL